MLADLKDAGCGDIVIRRSNYLAIDQGKVDCDLYRYKKRDVTAINAYAGQYLAQYSWGEFTAALLDNKHASFFE